MDRWTAEDCAKFIERAGFPQYKVRLLDAYVVMRSFVGVEPCVVPQRCRHVELSVECLPSARFSWRFPAGGWQPTLPPGAYAGNV